MPRVSRTAPAPAILLALVVAACGVQEPDLFALQRTGSIPGARLSLVVSDAGTARCNGGADRVLPPKLLLDARDLTRKVSEDAAHRRRFPPRPGSILSYRLRSGDGDVRWSDTSRPLGDIEFRLALLVRQIAQQACGLPR